MERYMRLSRAAVVLVAIALIASIAAAVWFASPDAPYVPSEDSGAALGAAAPAEDGYAEHETTVPSGYKGVYNASDVGTMRSEGRGSKADGGNYKYILMGNITIESIDLTAWTGEGGTPWKGELDGNGYTITINAATASGAYYDTGGLFSVIGGGAYVHDLTIVVQNVRVDNTANEGNANFGVIAGNACGAVTVDNVYIRLDKDSSGNGDAYVSSNGTTWLGGVFGKVEGSDVSISNTTVYNAAAGSRGFSGTMVNNSGVYVGGFVGSIDKGDLTASNIAYKADDDAKIFAVAESGASGWGGRNTTLTGGVLGYHNEGSFTLDGLIFDAKVSLDSNNNPNFGTQNGDNPHAAYIVGQVDGGLSDVWSDIYINADNGTTWLDGNNETRGTAVRYDKSVFADIRFADGEKVAVAVGKQSPANAGSIPRTITQGADTSKISDAEIAGAITEGSGTAWLTINKVNATTNVDMSVGDSVSTGNYNLTSPTISSVDGTTYKGSKEYDGTAYATPYITIGSEQINAWTADNTTADAGVKNFAYAGDSALTGYQVVSYANGDKYLVKGGTVYSPSTITIGGQSGQAFKLGNSFSYEITPAFVTVTPKVPTDLYAGNPMPEITATAVDSGGSPVEGKIAWDDPDATLISGKHSYAWTWTPNSSNYQTKTGSIELEAFDKEIVKLTIDGEFKTEYVAYDAFDSTGIEVTATYSDGTTAVLTDEYAFKIVDADGSEVEGGIGKLFVSYDEVTVYLLSGSEVTTTIPINVDYVRFVVEQKAYNKDITYGDSYQWNAADFYTWSDNTKVVETKMDFYEVGPDLTDDISGIATADAGTEFIGRVLCRAFYKDEEVPEEEYDNFIGIYNPDELASEVTLTIVPRKIEIESSGIDSGVYSGEPVDLRTLFTAQSVNDDVIALSFDITLNNETCDEVRGAGTYSVTASLAESVTNYTAEPVKITYTVTKLAIPKPQDAEEPIVYDGKEHDVTPTVPEYKVVDGTTKATNVGDYSVTIALADKANIEWEDGSSDDIKVTWSITPATVTITGEYSGKTYDGQVVDPSSLFTAQGVNNEGALQLEFAITVDDENSNEILNAGAYTVTASLAESVTNYTAAEKSITFTIETIKVSGSVAFTTSETYDGTEKVAEFTLTSPDVLIGDDQVTITYSGEEDRMNVTGEAITATAVLPSSNYDWVDGITPMASMTIVKATFTSVTIEFAEGALDNLFTSSAMPTPTTITANPTPRPAGVKGKFAWVESSLSEDTNTYHWTYTVPNYNVFNGTQELTAQAAVLESITLSGEYETEYTAYDFFDVENLVVTAHFSHGENQPGEDTTLALGEYTLTTASAKYDENGVPQLFVADDHVTVTYQGKSEQIVIKVAPKQIAAPNAATGLVYDGTEKDGVTGGDGYTLSGDTKATDANDYFATAVLTDKDNTTWTDGTTDDKTIEWSIAKMVVSGEIVAPESLVYDGAQKTVSFDGQLAGNDEFVIDYDGDRKNVTADGFTVTVSLPNDNNYEWANGVVTTATYKIEPKRVYLGHGDYTWGVSYNGKAILVAELGGNTGDGNVDLVFAYEDETLETKLDIVFDYVAREANGLTSLVDAGEYTIEFNLADSVVNYVADAYTTTLEITPMRVEATLTAPNEVYTGNEKNAILTVNTQLVGEDKVTVEYNNVNRIDYTGEEIVATAQLPNDNYVWADGTAPTASFTIQKATINRVTVTISDTPDGGWTTAMMPEFTSVSVEPDVEGTVVWDNGSLIAGENAEQPWTFVPATNNYEPYHGSVTLTVSQATLTDVSVEIVATKEYVAFDAFDRSSIAVEALYGEDRKPVTTGYTLTFSIGDEDRLLAGTGITVTVTYTDGDVTQYTEFTIDVAKRVVAKPVVDPTVFDATGETITLPIAASEYYTIYGNTAIEPGRYVATVELQDPANTMWEDGSTAVVSIAWTISEPVTSGEIIASILAMEKVTWQNAEEFLDLEARYNALDESEQTAEATAKRAVLRAQYDALRNAAFDDIEAAHEVTAKSLGKALAAAAAGLSAAAIALAIAKRRSI